MPRPVALTYPEPSLCERPSVIRQSATSCSRPVSIPIHLGPPRQAVASHQVSALQPRGASISPMASGEQQNRKSGSAGFGAPGRPECNEWPSAAPPAPSVEGTSRERFRVGPCVDGPRLSRETSVNAAAVVAAMCPAFRCGAVAAGHNAFRGSGSGQLRALEAPWPKWIVPITGSTRSALRAVGPLQPFGYAVAGEILLFIAKPIRRPDLA